MAIDALSVTRPSLRTLAGVRTIAPHLVLAGLVLVSTAIRAATAFAHATPRYFPDEYIYASLARSIGEGRLAVRGSPAHFPALLEPLLAAPFWLVADTAGAYRLTQGMHAAAMSLAAVPIYVLAGRLGLRPWERLSCAALTLLLPSLVFSSYLTADAVALPLALSAVACGVSALDAPNKKAQLAFLGFAGLASLARVQYVVLPLAFVVATGVVTRGRPRALGSRYGLTLALLGAPVLGALALGPSRVLGYYDAIFDLELDAGSLAHWAATDSLLLGYAAGWVLVPAAVVGLATALVRPRQRAEQGFAALVAALGLALLAEAALYAANGSERFQERYLIVLPPLVAPLFFLGVRRLGSRPAAIATAAVAGALALLAVRVPLSAYTADLGKQDSPLLQAVAQIEERTDAGTGALVASLAALAFAGVAALVAWRPQRFVVPAVVLAGVGLAAVSFGAVKYDLQRSGLARQSFLAADPSWVDNAGLGPTAVLLTPGSLRPAVSEQLFWNRSLDELVRMDGAGEVDVFGSSRGDVGRDGTLLADGRPLTKPLLVQEYASVAQLEGAELVRRTTNTSLWRPAGHPRLALLLDGRYFDGWLDARTTITVWPYPDRARHAVLRFTLANPEDAVTAVRIQAPGVSRTVQLAAHSRRPIALSVVAAEPWEAHITAVRPYLASGGRLVSAQLDELRLDDPSRSATSLPIETS